MGGGCMIAAILFGLLAAIAGLLFWIFIVMLIVKTIKKQPKKNTLIRSGVSGLLWIVFFSCSIVIGTKALINGDPLVNKIAESVGETTANIAEHSYEGIKKGWNKALLNKINKLSVSFVSIREIDKDERDTFDFADTNGKKIFEILLSIDNPLDASKKIPYRKINKEQLIFGKDVNGNYIPVFIIDDSGLSTIPWIFTFFLPTYRKDGASVNIPTGKSELRLRLDAAEKDSIEKIIFGEKDIPIPKTPADTIDL
ncbi:hypothetical protein [Treponema socranskii]|uniref:hypothetical protein n=2 Tax=Treponemataceae TaxID=2845253 RepID=UPI0023F24059|nr:hypothetical protein [Treponema socranskii]